MNNNLLDLASFDLSANFAHCVFCPFTEEDSDWNEYDSDIQLDWTELHDYAVKNEITTYAVLDSFSLEYRYMVIYNYKTHKLAFL